MIYKLTLDYLQLRPCYFQTIIKLIVRLCLRHMNIQHNPFSYIFIQNFRMFVSLMKTKYSALLLTIISFFSYFFFILLFFINRYSKLRHQGFLVFISVTIFFQKRFYKLQIDVITTKLNVKLIKYIQNMCYYIKYQNVNILSVVKIMHPTRFTSNKYILVRQVQC